MFVVAIIPEGRSDPCPHSLRGSGRGGAGLLSEDPAPCAYVLGKWLRGERQHPSIRLPVYPSNTTRCRDLRHAARRALEAILTPLGGPSMHDPANDGLRRILLLRTRLNRV